MIGINKEIDGTSVFFKEVSRDILISSRYPDRLDRVINLINYFA